jgi:hypothetical protein
MKDIWICALTVFEGLGEEGLVEHDYLVGGGGLM